jgi:hypothetical protein
LKREGAASGAGAVLAPLVPALAAAAVAFGTGSSDFVTSLAAGFAVGAASDALVALGGEAALAAGAAADALGVALGGKAGFAAGAAADALGVALGGEAALAAGAAADALGVALGG